MLARLNFPLFSFETLLTIRQNSLYVTVCMIVRTSCQGYFIHSLSTLYYYNAPSLTTRLTGDYRDRTCTGKCGPALLDTQSSVGSFRSPYLVYRFFRKFIFPLWGQTPMWSIVWSIVCAISFNERSAFNCIFHSLIFCFIAVLAFSLTAGVKPTKNFPSLFLFSLGLNVYPRC